MQKEMQFKEIENILPMTPNEGPPLPRMAGVTWESIGAKPSTNVGATPSSSLAQQLNEIAKAIPEMPKEVETVTDVIFNGLLAIRGAQGILRAFKGLGTPEGF